MRCKVSKESLITEFPELVDPNIVLQKEVFAHFGLALMKFGLVEHSLINILVFWGVGEGIRKRTIRTRSDWESAFDHSYDKAAAQTLGNLVKKVALIDEFHSLGPELAEVKRLRDYFAHRFM